VNESEHLAVDRKRGRGSMSFVNGRCNGECRCRVSYDGVEVVGSELDVKIISHMHVRVRYT